MTGVSRFVRFRRDERAVRGRPRAIRPLMARTRPVKTSDSNAGFLVRSYSEPESHRKTARAKTVEDLIAA
ncbi:hypothetical protein [Streptomyces sp. NPDC101165]|uniref:hypothetical protein n=1 Tax=Streptomyces sp. NPDC101165 TaxID=3366119 RepID=UPI0037F8359F